MAGPEREPDAAVVQADAGGGLEHVAPEAAGVRLDERHRRTIGIGGAQVHRPAVRNPGDERRATVAVDHGPAAGDLVLREQRADVGVLVEHRRPVAPGGPRRLDEEVHPAAVGRVVGQRQALGDQCAEQDEVALAVGRDGPQVVAPGTGAERLDPVGQRPGEVVGGVLAGPEVEQAVAERAFVEAGASVLDDGGEGQGHAGATHAVAGA
jgi:hypothetical protein